MQGLQIFLAFGFGMPEKLFVLVENRKVVHVAEVIAATQSFLNEMVEAVQVDIGKKLRCQISYRNPFLDGWMDGWMDARRAPPLSQSDGKFKILPISHIVSSHAIFRSMRPRRTS